MPLTHVFTSPYRAMSEQDMRNYAKYLQVNYLSKPEYAMLSDMTTFYGWANETDTTPVQIWVADVLVKDLLASPFWQWSKVTALTPQKQSALLFVLDQQLQGRLYTAAYGTNNIPSVEIGAICPVEKYAVWQFFVDTFGATDSMITTIRDKLLTRPARRWEEFFAIGQGTKANPSTCFPYNLPEPRMHDILMGR